MFYLTSLAIFQISVTILLSIEYQEKAPKDYEQSY